MTLSLLLMLALSQTDPLLPDSAPLPTDLPKEALLIPPPAPQPPSVFTRSLLATGGGTLAGGISLGIALLLVGTNPNFDPNFATAALASLLITGVAFAIHCSLAGRGEVTLSFLLTAVVRRPSGSRRPRRRRSRTWPSSSVRRASSRRSESSSRRISGPSATSCSPRADSGERSARP